MEVTNSAARRLGVVPDFEQRECHRLIEHYTHHLCVRLCVCVFVCVLVCVCVSVCRRSTAAVEDAELMVQGYKQKTVRRTTWI